MRVLTRLETYFCPKMEEVKVEHLSLPSSINISTEVLYNEIIELLDKFDIPYSNLMSVLVDSFSVMRGSKKKESRSV